MPDVVLREVVWTDGRYSSFTARIGNIIVGGVTYSMVRNAELPWIASDAFTHRRKGAKSIEEAKQLAEAMLAQFVRALVQP